MQIKPILIENEKVIYSDINYLVDYSWNSEPEFIGIDFKAFKVISLSDEEFSGSSLRTEISPTLFGNVKWDGCLNFQIKNNGSIHFCDKELTKKFTMLFDKIYEKAKEVGCDV